MVTRRVGAISALAFGLLLAFVVIDQDAYMGFNYDWRAVLAAAAILGAVTALFGKPIWILIVTMLLPIATYFQVTVDTIHGMLSGRWAYSHADVWSLPLIILPLLSVLFAILADGRLQAAYRLVRRGPFQENF